jgi:hypothetical protein
MLIIRKLLLGQSVAIFYFNQKLFVNGKLLTRHAMDEIIIAASLLHGAEIQSSRTKLLRSWL